MAYCTSAIGIVPFVDDVANSIWLPEAGFGMTLTT
jgi:hypothetical protein